MAFRLKQGKTKFMWLPMTTSTISTAGDLMVWLAGKITRYEVGRVNTTVAGVIRHSIAATDSDYATARLVEIEVPVQNYVVWEVPVTSGLVAADVGLFQDLTSAGEVTRAASTHDLVQCVKVISTTKGWFVLNAGLSGFGAVGAA